MKLEMKSSVEFGPVPVPVPTPISTPAPTLAPVKTFQAKSYLLMKS